jgi:hypothetical protein
MDKKTGGVFFFMALFFSSGKRSDTNTSQHIKIA